MNQVDKLGAHDRLFADLEFYCICLGQTDNPFKTRDFGFDLSTLLVEVVTVRSQLTLAALGSPQSLVLDLIKLPGGPPAVGHDVGVLGEVHEPFFDHLQLGNILLNLSTLILVSAGYA